MLNIFLLLIFFFYAPKETGCSPQPFQRHWIIWQDSLILNGPIKFIIKERTKEFFFFASYDKCDKEEFDPLNCCLYPFSVYLNQDERSKTLHFLKGVFISKDGVLFFNNDGFCQDCKNLIEFGLEGYFYQDVQIKEYHMMWTTYSLPREELFAFFWKVGEGVKVTPPPR